ncbi:MAG: ABC transporter ATP-binding protein, partial [bacterium]|nr:ABC transporter ATP-binding protein [bacterium]
MLSVRNLVKTYQTTKSKKKNRFKALDNVSIEFPEHGLVFILGKSGSGKSTLLNSIGGLDSFDSGEIIIKGKSSKNFSQQDFDSYRNTFIGFIFQEYNILENFSVAKNLALAIELQGLKADKQRVLDLLEQVDLKDYAKRKPNQLSGGQKQRVAIARALIKNPEIIMADEPTGALDSATGKQVMETLQNLSKTKLVIVVSHDRDFAETYGDRIIELKDGKVISDQTKKEITAAKTASGISVVNGEYIHIGKGQNITVEDLQVIGRTILENSKNSDTIITLGDVPNQKVKKLVNITNSGDQETFQDTTSEDIKKEEYRSGDLRLIKSKLKFSDSFKIGASALKYKVGKLFFTILLAVFAFTCFGIIDAFASWNRADSVNQAVSLTKQNNISIQKRIRGESSYYYKLAISENDVQALESKFENYDFVPVYSRGASSYMSIDGLDSNSNEYTLYGCCAFGFMSVEDTNQLSNLGLTLQGSLPQNANEICISKHLYECFKKANETIHGFDDIKNKFASFSGFSGDYKIVGIIDDGTDLSKYKENNSESFNSSNYMQIQAMVNDLNYSYARMVYVNNETLQKCINNGFSNIDLYMYCENTSNNRGINISFYDGVPSMAYIKRNSLELQDNEIILSASSLKNALGLSSTSELKQLIDSGLTIKATSSGMSDMVLTVVGYNDDGAYVVNNYTKDMFSLANNSIYFYTM